MKCLSKSTTLKLVLCAWAALTPMLTSAEDIDIFTGASAGTAAAPNVLIVLDNTSNWARQSQQWPGGAQQGQSEANAIKTVLNALGAAGTNINIGLMEFATTGSANIDGGFIRSAVRQMNATNVGSFSTKLTTIYNNITSPAEKLASGMPYGDLMYDVYNYYAGAAVSNDGQNATQGLNPPNLDTDSNGYTTNYSQFKSPVSADKSCARNFIIFIGNPNAQGPVNDTAANTAALLAAGGDSSYTAQLPLPLFTTTTINAATLTLGTTTGCYASQAAAQSAYGWGLNAADNLCELYHAMSGTGTAVTDGASQSCSSYSGTTPTATPTDWQTACASYTQGCSIGTAMNLTSTVTTGAWTPYMYPAPTSSTGNSAGYTYLGLTCPSEAIAGTCNFTVDNSTGTATSPITKPTTLNGTETASTSSCFTPDGTATADIPSGAYAYPTGQPVIYTNGTSSDVSVGGTGLPSSMASYLVTSPTSQCLTTGADGQCNLKCPAYTNCSYSWVLENRSAGCPKSTGKNAIQSYPLDVTMTPKQTTSYWVSMSYLKYDNTNTCVPTSLNHFQVNANNTQLVTSPTNSTFTDTGPHNADEWARLLFKKGVPVFNADGTAASNATVQTYTIDVYNKQPNAYQTSLLLSMARNGGGKYFSATNESAIRDALTAILAEIQSTNSTFASASLPVNSTNRAQNANQVFIGMFRPDPGAAPRWFGNLKQYQIGGTAGALDLYDASTPSKPAINLQTGFLDDCAQSFWTNDSPTTATTALPWTASYYWNNISGLVVSPASKCTLNNPYNLYSDIPDGAFVEKGAVAEILRKGNDPANSTPTWSFNRTMYTLSSNLLVAYSSSNSGLSTDAFNYTQGKDVEKDPLTGTLSGQSGLTNWTSDTNVMRPTVHGDVVHSRPLPINYGTSSAPNAGVTAFYGANDGTFRAVLASGSNAGQELWAFVAPEFSSIGASRNFNSSVDPLTRLEQNSPKISYPITPAVVGGMPKDYFFDGSTGVFQNIDNSKVWVYPSMRRGGRMLYAFDVTNSNPSALTSSPVAFKWRAGCPNLVNDTGCSDGTGTNGVSGIGQTWSTPSPVPIKGYSTTNSAVVIGGGYDNCEDADTATPSCSTGKGHAVYIFDADTGALVASFPTLRSVIGDVAFIDIDNDTYVDYAYVVDTGGNVYRINFADPFNNNAPLSSASWTIQRIAYTSGGGRKFEWAPALLPSSGKVYLAFASGDREHPLISNYPYTTPVTNRLYVFIDNPTSISISTNDLNHGVDLDGGTMSNFSSGTTCTTAGIGTAANTNQGWYMDFGAPSPTAPTTPVLGEQAVTSAVIAGGMVTVSTNRPIPPLTGTCSTSLGEARGYWVNLYNASGAMGVTGSCGGSRFGMFAGGGLPPSPVIGVVPVNGVPTTVLIGAIQREGGASSPIAPQILKPVIQSTRKLRYWKRSGDN